MKTLRTIEITEADFVPGKEHMAFPAALSAEAERAILDAEIVIYRGEVVKNRVGRITARVDWQRSWPYKP